MHSSTQPRIFGIAAVVGTLFFVGHLYAMSSRRLEAVPFTALLATTALCPIALWWWLLSRIKSSGVRTVFTYAGAMVFAAGFAVYFDGGFVHFDALYAVIFIFFPAMQVLVLAMTYLLGRVYENRRARKNS